MADAPTAEELIPQMAAKNSLIWPSELESVRRAITCTALHWSRGSVCRVALRSRDARLFVDRCKLNIPWLGRLIRAVAIARFARLLGTLTRGGISVVEGMDIVQPAVGNEVISDAMRSMSQQMRSGDSVASVMKKAQVFPPLPIQMVAVGEETGHLAQMLLRMADVYEREAATATRVMTSLLAPALILCVAAVVGFIILSMLLPIFQLSSVMR